MVYVQVTAVQPDCVSCSKLQQGRDQCSNDSGQVEAVHGCAVLVEGTVSYWGSSAA